MVWRRLSAFARKPLGLLTGEEQVETVGGQDGGPDGAVAVGGVAHVGWVKPLERDGWVQRDAVCGVVSLSSAWRLRVRHGSVAWR